MLAALHIAVDDPRTSDIRALLKDHLVFNRAASPPEHVHALELAGLLDLTVTFFSARQHATLLGVGALKRLDDSHGELKSMHTTQVARRQGVARAMVAHILRFAGHEGLSRVSVETGTMDEFEPARRLYQGFGFVRCAPFANYTENPYSTCMTISLTAEQPPQGQLPSLDLRAGTEPSPS